MSLVETPGKLLRRAELYNQLGSFVSSGVTLQVALTSVADKRSARHFSAAIHRILNYLQMGDTFAQALHKEPGIIPEFDRSLLEAGENSGRLDECFRMLGDYYADTAALMGKTLWAMAYPFFILHLAVIIFPTSTLVGLINGEVTTFLVQKGMALGVIYGLIVFLMYSLSNQRTMVWRSAMEKILGFVPLLGTARKYLALARLSASLGALLSAGVGTVEAWALAGRSCGSETLRRVTKKFGPKIENGETPSSLVSASWAFPDLFASAYEAGEVSGKLDDCLQRIYRNYKEEASSKLRQFSFWLPNLFFLFIAIGVAYFIITFYMEHFQGLGDALEGM